MGSMNMDWPAPPFYAMAEEHPAGMQGRDCIVELVDGQLAVGKLEQFDLDGNLIVIKAAESEELTSFPIERVRIIKVIQPLPLRLDSAAIQGVGVAEKQLANKKDFRVRFSDGGELSGKTLGFVKEKSGLFLFPSNGGVGSTVSCFIPAHALSEFNIGPLLGDTLTANNVVPPRVIAAALDKQLALRNERLGEFLRDRAIVSHAELTKALEEQKRRPNMPIGQVLLEAKLVTQGQIDQAILAQKANRSRRLGDILIDMGAVSREQIQVALAQKLGIPFIDVRQFEINADALRLVQPAYAKQHQLLPLMRSKHSLVVAVENPFSIDFVHELRVVTGLSIVPVMATATELKARIVKEYARLEDRSVSVDWDSAMFGSAEIPERGLHDGNDKLEMQDLATQLSQEAPLLAELALTEKSATLVEKNTLVRLVNKMIMDAHAQGASDIHIESNPGKLSMRIRFRKDGALVDYLELEPVYCVSLVSRIKIMAGLDISEHRHAQDGKIDFSRYGGIPIELRVAVIPTANNLEDVVLRILAGAEPLPIDKLGLSVRNLSELKKMLERSYGLILVCGPTGSGKTTTLHSVLHHINEPDVKIWTAEDPIEITQLGLRQVQVNAKIDWTFAAAMRAFLRADPDIIMVGEMRDEETAKIGIEASLTGHLVFSTIHTNSAAESIVRLLDLGMDPFNFADALIGILSQRLARRLCAKCKQPHLIGDNEISELAKEYCVGTGLDLATTVRTWHAKFGMEGKLQLYTANANGCGACNAGYKGRVGLHELLVATPRIKQLIHAHATMFEIAEAAIADGMTLLRQDGIEKVLQGEIDLVSARSAFS